jgi:hypothetical protein
MRLQVQALSRPLDSLRRKRESPERTHANVSSPFNEAVINCQAVCLWGTKVRRSKGSKNRIKKKRIYVEDV